MPSGHGGRGLQAARGGERRGWPCDHSSPGPTDLEVNTPGPQICKQPGPGTPDPRWASARAAPVSMLGSWRLRSELLCIGVQDATGMTLHGFFLGPHLRHMEFPRLGVESALSGPTPQPQQRGVRPTAVTYTTAHGNTRSLTHRARPGMERASSWMLVRFVSPEP